MTNSQKKQESVSDWMELAKAYAKAEKETIAPYVIVLIEDKSTGETLFKYDIPRDFLWKFDWVIRWRKSRFHCQRPKNNIIQILQFYDRKTGLEFGFGSLLSRLVAAKSQQTILLNKLQKYKSAMASSLFFNEETDEVVKSLKCKIEQQKIKQRDFENEIKKLIQPL